MAKIISHQKALKRAADGGIRSWDPNGEHVVTQPPTSSGDGYTIEGNVLTLNAPAGVSFGTKPGGALPWFLWRAINGVEPVAALCRHPEWYSGQDKFNGELTTDDVAPGSTQAVVHDMFVQSGSTCGSIYIPASAQKIICARRRKDPFTHEEALATRSRFYKSGTESIADLIEDDMWVRGVMSGATGKILKFNNNLVGNSSPHSEFFFYPDAGSVDLSVRDPLFANGETMEIYTDDTFTTVIGSVTNSEGDGTYFTFNNKIIRFWPEGTLTQNFYVSEPSWRAEFCVEATRHDVPKLNIPAQQYAVGVHNHDYHVKTWISDIWHFWRSDYNVKNGRMWLEKDDLVTGQDMRWITVGDGYPSHQEVLHQMQVSGGTTPRVRRYMDYILVDDSEYYVKINNAAHKPILVPCTSWGEEVITANLDILLPDWTTIEVFVDGEIATTYTRQE